MVKVSDEKSIMLSGENNYKKAALKLLQKGPCIIAVTLGDKGVYLACNKGNSVIPGFKAAVTDIFIICHVVHFYFYLIFYINFAFQIISLKFCMYSR